jgi:bacteriocin-like protein
MTQMENGRCFGRVKARELTEKELALVSGGGEDHQHGRFHLDGPITVGEADNDYCIGGAYTTTWP